MSETDDGWGMVMPFLDGSETYVLGFEAGKVWGMCEANDWPNRVMAHTKNVPQIEMMAKHFRCDLFVDASMDPEWCDVTFVQRPLARLALVQPEGTQAERVDAAMADHIAAVSMGAAPGPCAAGSRASAEARGSDQNPASQVRVSGAAPVVQEPHEGDLPVRIWLNDNGHEQKLSFTPIAGAFEHFEYVPASPQPIVPLSDEQIEAAFHAHEWSSVPHPFRGAVGFDRGVRFAERAHGIRTQEQSTPGKEFKHV